MTSGTDWDGLVAGCLSGSQDAWQAFLEVSYSSVLKLFIKRTGREELARDLTQSFFLKLFDDEGRRLRSFDSSRGVPFPIYLRVLAARHHIDWTRGREGQEIGRRVGLADVVDYLEKAADCEKALVAREVREAVADLPPRERLATQLVLEGLRVSEIARALGLTDGGASALLWRARQHLAKMLEGGWSDTAPKSDG
ncbi:MAG: sigma-70 family RNA polymerase sigma factor [Candidatus Eisenbacteria sp.]|nr:sigma-70 family RNA polymerase sigma factor [Candidatus Eisenbacteria bacterium]